MTARDDEGVPTRSPVASATGGDGAAIEASLAGEPRVEAPLASIPPPAREPFVFFAVLAGATLLGAFLRLHRLSEQILMDDEWHSLVALQGHGWWELMTHFGEADRCIPLTLWHKLLAVTAGMDESLARALPAVCGLATVLILPLALRRHVGDATAAVLAALLAIAPLLVYFSRFARPYAGGLLFSWLALLGLHAWCVRSRLRSAAAFVGFAALAVWFLPLCAPFLFAGWLVTLRHRTLGLGLAAGAAGAVLLLPPLIADFGSLLAKSGRDVVTIDTLDGTLALFSGVAPRTLAGTVVVAAAWGGWRLCRGKPLLVRMLLVATAAQAVVVGLSGAQIVTAPSVFSRYCLTALPLFLLALAAAIAASAAALGRRLRAARPITLLSAPLLLLALGPWLDAYWFPNQWTNHPVLQADYGLHRDEIERTFFPAGISGAYALLSGLPPASITIVETPFPHGFPANPYPILQRHHRQRVIGGFGGELGTLELTGWPPGRGREPRWRASLTDLDGLRRRGARFVFVHRDLQAEFPRLMFEWPPVAAPSERFLRERLGEPLFADRWVAVFDLAR